MLLPSPFVFKLVSEQNITHHRQKKKLLYLSTDNFDMCVMLSTTVYRVYVYGINACLSTELNLGVAKTTYIIYSKVLKKKMLGLKCNCANVLAPSFALENIRHIFFVLKYVHRSTTLNKSSINPLLNLEISSPTQITLYS